MALFATIQPLVITNGESKTWRLSVVDENGVAFDLTGSTVTITVKANVSDKTALLTKDSTNPNNIEILDQVSNTGKADVKFVPADTSSLSVGRYKYDVWVTFPDLNEQQVVKTNDFTVESKVK